MERLTEYDSLGEVYVKQHDYITASEVLAKYEDTGLTPEQVQQLKERDIAKKPLEEKDTYTPKLGEFRTGKCPNCGAGVVDKFNICFECRQRFDWSEVE